MSEEPEQDQYALENADGTECVIVPKWLYDHVLGLESHARSFPRS